MKSFVRIFYIYMYRPYYLDRVEVRRCSVANRFSSCWSQLHFFSNRSSNKTVLITPSKQQEALCSFARMSSESRPCSQGVVQESHIKTNVHIPSNSLSGHPWKRDKDLNHAVHWNSTYDAGKTDVDGSHIELPAEALDSVSEALPPRQMKAWVWFLLSSAVLFATLLLALDNTIVADLQPQVIEALGEINKFPWINHTFDLGSVGTGLLW